MILTLALTLAGILVGWLIEETLRRWALRRLVLETFTRPPAPITPPTTTELHSGAVVQWDPNPINVAPAECVIAVADARTGRWVCFHRSHAGRLCNKSSGVL